MLDPLSPHLAPPRRYLLDSDSSDEEGQGVYAASSARPSSSALSTPEVALQWEAGESNSFDRVILGVGQAGRYLLAKIKPDRCVLSIQGGTERGRGYRSRNSQGEDVLVCGVDVDERGEDYAVAETILREIRAVHWTIFTTYLPSMYIPSSTSVLPANPPIRCISRSPSTLDKNVAMPFESPNYTTGLAAALTSLSAHPASPLPSHASFDLLLLPLPLSSIHPQSLDFLEVSLDGKWSEWQDEPYQAPGSGRPKPLSGVRDKPVDLDMYM